MNEKVKAVMDRKTEYVKVKLTFPPWFKVTLVPKDNEGGMDVVVQVPVTEQAGPMFTQAAMDEVVETLGSRDGDKMLDKHAAAFWKEFVLAQAS